MERPGLELHTDQKFQRSKWRAQRVGWGVWFIILCAGLLGVFGSGPLSKAVIQDDDGRFTATFDRFARYHSPTLHGQRGKRSDVELTVSRGLLNRIQITRIEPEPLRSELSDNGITHAFAQTAESDDGQIVFHIDFERIGWSGGQINLTGGTPVVLNQFVYP
jgi:hypothetical protein